ncbi:MAG: 5'-methylthioadenosine/adenosylhomocysteine nucleosidase [Candidatus Ancillula sp.]|jgi:adenosylhomocysteine nucleosidase|nr:5'-methylthioadenosine/adenosylhomocysteine nucleosidase [Candidatus Ancillula sp.]
MRLGIICALKVEINDILTQCADVQKQEIAGTTCYMASRIGTAQDIEVILMLCGMGLSNAAAGTQLLISHFGVDTVIFSGIAGSLQPEHAINSLVVGSKLKYIDTDSSLIAESLPHLEVFHADKRLIALALETAQNLGIELQPAIIASGNRFISRQQDVESIRTKLNASVVEMEGAAVTHICMKNNIPSLIIRTISDYCDTCYEDFGNQKFEICQAAQKSAYFVVKFCEQIAKYQKLFNS